jgi:hypothetical protein
VYSEEGTVTVATFEDVVAQILPLAPTLSEQEIRDILITTANNPSAGKDLLDAYAAANMEVPQEAWVTIWNFLQSAAQVASVISAIGGAVAIL